jgi:hypothetical protein
MVINMDNFKLVIEGLKRDARFQVGLSAEQSNALAQQVGAMTETLNSLAQRTQAIRADTRLSDQGKIDDTAQARTEAQASINKHAQQISRQAIITDLTQRVATRTNGAREKAKAAMGPDAGLLAQELRQSVLPKLIKNGEQLGVKPARTLEKLIQQAAEKYGENPSKAETIIGALSVGWPWCPDLPEGALQEVERTIARQVAGEEQAQLEQAQAVQRLVDHATGEALKMARNQA